MTALRVRASGEAMRSGDILPVIASMPISLAAEEPGRRGALVAIDGSSGWPQRVADALVNAARGLLVVHPAPVPASEVPTAPFVPVVVDYRFAGNPAMTRAADAFGRWPAGSLIEATAVVGHLDDLDRTLVDQLATLRRLGMPAAGLTTLTWRPSGYYLSGDTAHGSPLLLSAHVTSGRSPTLRVRGLAPELAVELTVPDPTTAQPAVLVRTTAHSSTTTPTIWETSHRAAWRRLHTAVAHARQTDDLADLRADLATAGQVLRAG